MLKPCRKRWLQVPFWVVTHVSRHVHNLFNQLTQQVCHTSPWFNITGMSSIFELVHRRVAHGHQPWFVVHFWTAIMLEKTGIRFVKIEGESLFFHKIWKRNNENPNIENWERHEQLFPCLYDRFVRYVKFMDCLIKTGKDVELLSECGIRDNY